MGRSREMRGWMPLAAAAALALLATGCGGSAAGSPVAPSSPAAPSSDATRLSLSLGDTSNSLVLPLTAYSPSLDQVAEVQTGEQAVAARCMRKDGFSFPVTSVSPLTLGADPGRGEFYDFGVTSLAFASVHGYHDREPTRASAPALPDLSPSSAEAAAYTTCYGAAEQQSGFAALQPYIRLYQAVGRAAWQQTLASPVVAAGFKRWAACMAAQGYDYANPTQAALGEPGDSQVPTQWDLLTTAGPSRREIQTAQSDVRCKGSTGLLKQWIGVVAEEQAQLVRKYLPRLRAGYAAYEQALVRLRSLAAGS
jgi:hypothetical protein